MSHSGNNASKRSVFYTESYNRAVATVVVRVFAMDRMLDRGLLNVGICQRCGQIIGHLLLRGGTTIRILVILRVSPNPGVSAEKSDLTAYWMVSIKLYTNEVTIDATEA